MPIDGPESQGVSLGENARVVVNGTTILCVKRGTVTEAPAEISTTCTGSGGFNSRTRGPKDLVIDLEAQWRWSDNPFGNPPNIEPGEDLASVYVYPDHDNAPEDFYQLPLSYVASATCTIDAEGVQTWSMQLKNQGVYYTPSRRQGG